MNIVKLMSFFLINLFLAMPIYAFKSEKCAKVMGAGQGLGLIVSTSSYISSTGECSMIGHIEHDQKLFIAQAGSPLEVDMAKGGGEYVDAFAEISICNSLGRVELKKELQKNFSKIYEEDIGDVEKIHSRILSVMRSSYVIDKNCKLDS